MGLGIGAITLLLEEDGRRPLAGSIVTLGRQTIFAKPSRLAELLARHGKSWPASAAVEDTVLLRALGFDEIVSIDASDFEHPTRLLNLNEPVTPPDLIGRFDVVLDSGTLEHVFHVPNALAHIGRMVRPGGRIIHLSPSSNYFDHGFYMFSPTLFFDYYRENGGLIEVAKLIRHRGEGGAWDVFDYDPLLWRRIGVGGLDGHAYLIFAVIVAGDRPIGERPPRQSYYVEAWEGRAPLRAEGRPVGGMRARLARMPRAVAIARRLRGVARLALTGTVFGKRPVARIANE